MLTFFGFFNRLFGAIGSWFQSPLMLVLRLIFGIGFMMTGFGKLQDVAKFSEYLVSLQIPYPEVSAWLVALTELIGGFLLAIGFLARFAAVPLIIVMSVAYATAHADALKVITEDPKVFLSQAPFNYLLTALLVWTFGPGFFSLDHFLFKRHKAEQKPEESPHA